MKVLAAARSALVIAFGAALFACQGPAGANGSSCTVKSNGDGTSTISCTDGTSVTVHDGTNGTDGSNGTNGSSCTVADNGDGTRTISCTDGTSVVVTDGTNGSSCTVTDNHNGTKTIRCTDGTSVTVADGLPGASGDVHVKNFHGAAYLQTVGEFANGAKSFVNTTITSAAADAAGVVTVEFNVKDAAGGNYTALASVGANIDKLVPPSGNASASVWVPYLYSKATVTTSGGWPNPVGTYTYQPTRESNGTLTNLGNGNYRYVFAKNLSNVVVDGTPIAYERNLTHRVTVMTGGHSGPTSSASYDFVPDGSPVTTTRNIVETQTCQQCHGWQFHGHGGDRITAESCTTCHTPSLTDPESGNVLDLKVMVHKIHAGGELTSIPGPDGIVWDNPATTVNEAADNGFYGIWGYRNTLATWWKAEFPAVIENCTKCHQGSGAQVDNWKTNPSNAACTSCHDATNANTGLNHVGGPQLDRDCHACHPADGAGIGLSVTTAHDWTQETPREISEFDVTLSLSAPANGQYYVAGESPVVSVQMRDHTTGALLDHTTVAEDAAAEGCTAAGPCPPRDGLFTGAGLFVHGPRAHRMPVLTTSARSQVFSSGTGPFDLSAASAALVLKADQGQNLVGFDSSGGDYPMPGTLTVNVSAGTFANKAAATTDEIVTWLNANAQFKARAIAWNQNGKVGIRSRNLGRVHALQLQASAVTTAVFGGDVAVHMPAGSTVSNNVAKRIDPTKNDPKVTWTQDAILYALDPVDDLDPGTYVVTVEINDRGRIDDNNWQTPSVAKLPFQVKTAAPEKAPAGNCASCHEGPDGRGYILDPMRHHKIFDDTAVDQCGACHDYQPQTATGAAYPGAKPIAKRVHAVHNGAELHYPNATVDHADTVPGRNWDIEFPQDVRNCETCHPAGSTSGSWATKAARLPCMGCHDGDAATAHMRLMTYDPTPADPWSGDEEESCQTCH